jgi:hypothetical protein
MPDSPDGMAPAPPYVSDIARPNQRDTADERDTTMTAEINLLTAAHDHQAELLAEAEARRLTRPTRSKAGSRTRSSGRLHTLLRRLAGAPTFA